MRITLLTYGSRGDVQPFLALAQALQNSGHTPLLAAPHRFSNLAAEYAIPFFPLPGDPEELSIRINDSRQNMFKLIESMSDFVISIAGPVWQAVKSACATAELIVHSFLFTTGAHSLARELGIPDVSVQLFPVFAPTQAFPMIALPDLPPGPISYASHWFSTQLFWRVGKAGFQRLRANDPDLFKLTLAWPFDWRKAEKSNRHPTPLIFAYSPSLLPRPNDWTNPNIHLTGYFFAQTPKNYTPSAELQAFLDKGSPPVCITFGSMISKEARHITELVQSALQICGMRGVFLTGWGGIEIHSANLFSVPAAPHEWLLSHCSAIIHHGGAGTTAASLRAGIPNVIIPHGADQPFWGRCVARAGAGPEPLDIHHLTAQNLVDALAKTQLPAIQTRARQLAACLEEENGTQAAVQILENLAQTFY